MKVSRPRLSLAALACMAGLAGPCHAATDGPWYLRFDDRSLEVSSLRDGKPALSRSIELGDGTIVAAAWADARSAWILRLDPRSLQQERWLVDLRDGRTLAALSCDEIPVRTADGWVVFAQDGGRTRPVAAGQAPPFVPIAPPPEWLEGSLAAPPALGEQVARWNSAITVGGTAAVESPTAVALTPGGVVGFEGTSSKTRQIVSHDLRARPWNARSFADGKHVLLLEEPQTERVNRNGAFVTFLIGAVPRRVLLEPDGSESYVVGTDLTVTQWPVLTEPAVPFAPDHVWIRQGERMVRWSAGTAQVSTGAPLPANLVALPWISTEPGGSRAVFQLVGALRSSVRTYILDGVTGVLTELPKPKPSRSESGRGQHLGTVRFHFWTTGQVAWGPRRE